jgi:hypothetical protein
MRATTTALGLTLLATVLTGCAGEETPGLLADYDETVTVYVFKDDDADTKPSQNLLYPMQVDVDGEPTVEAAVEALTTYEPEKPYDTLWTGSCAIGKDLDKVTVTDKQIRVHFNESGGDLCDLSSPDLLEQQIAWTVRTATGSEAPVTVTVGDADADVLTATRVRAQEKYLAPQQ